MVKHLMMFHLRVLGNFAGRNLPSSQIINEIQPNVEFQLYLYFKPRSNDSAVKTKHHLTLDAQADLYVEVITSRPSRRSQHLLGSRKCAMPENGQGTSHLSSS